MNRDKLTTHTRPVVNPTSATADRAATPPGVPATENVHKTVSNPCLVGLSFQKVPGDGHCLFHAIGLSIGQDASFLRRIVAAHMEENFAEFKAYRPGSDEEFKEYIEAIRNGEEWGDHVEIEIIQRITGRPVIIVRPDANPTIPDNIDRYNEDPIFIYYDACVQHYDAFVIETGYHAKDILRDIQSRIEKSEPIQYRPVTQFYQYSPPTRDVNLRVLSNLKLGKRASVKAKRITAIGQMHLHMSRQGVTHAAQTWQIIKPIESFTGRASEVGYYKKDNDEQEWVDGTIHRIMSAQNAGNFAVLSQMSSISGLGGVGKTETARAYAYHYAEYYDYNGIEINAENRTTLRETFQQAAQRLNIATCDEKGEPRDIKQIVDETYWYFAKTLRKKCLFVFDNADCYDDLKAYLPASLPPDAIKPHVLMTSRNRDWGRHMKSITVLPLDVWPASEALAFVKAELKIELSDIQHDIAIEQLIGPSYLQYLPLALQQAVTYIQQERTQDPNFTIENYLSRWSASTEQALAFPLSKDSDNCYEKTVATTWLVTLDKIKSKDQSELAVSLLEWMAYMDNHHIPEVFFLRHTDDIAAINGALHLLKKYSLIESDESVLVVGKTVKLHRLVQTVTRIKCQQEGRALNQLSTVLAHLKVMCEDKRMATYHYLHHVIAVGELLLTQQERHDGPNHEVMVETLLGLSDTYHELGDAPKQCELLERALAIQEKWYGRDDERVADTLIDLSGAYQWLGDHQKDCEVLERALAIRKAHYGPDHWLVAYTLVDLGDAFGYSGDHQKQCELFERALAIQTAHYGPDHESVAQTLLKLGKAYKWLGDHQKQRELLELVVRKKWYVSDHQAMVQTLVDLGGAYANLGDTQKQCEVLECVLAIRKAHYGRDDETVAEMLVDLGPAYGCLGDHQKECDVLERALAIREEWYGRDDERVAETLVYLGDAYECLGDHHKECEVLERACVILESNDTYRKNTQLQKMAQLLRERTQLQKQLLQKMAQLQKQLLQKNSMAQLLRERIQLQKQLLQKNGMAQLYPKKLEYLLQIFQAQGPEDAIPPDRISSNYQPEKGEPSMKTHLPDPQTASPSQKSMTEVATAKINFAKTFVERLTEILNTYDLIATGQLPIDEKGSFSSQGQKAASALASAGGKAATAGPLALLGALPAIVSVAYNVYEVPKKAKKIKRVNQCFGIESPALINTLTRMGLRIYDAFEKDMNMKQGHTKLAQYAQEAVDRIMSYCNRSLKQHVPEKSADHQEASDTLENVLLESFLLGDSPTVSRWNQKRISSGFFKKIIDSAKATLTAEGRREFSAQETPQEMVRLLKERFFDMIPEAEQAQLVETIVTALHHEKPLNVGLLETALTDTQDTLIQSITEVEKQLSALNLRLQSDPIPPEERKETLTQQQQTLTHQLAELQTAQTAFYHLTQTLHDHLDTHRREWLEQQHITHQQVDSLKTAVLQMIRRLPALPPVRPTMSTAVLQNASIGPGAKLTVSDVTDVHTQVEGLPSDSQVKLYVEKAAGYDKKNSILEGSQLDQNAEVTIKGIKSNVLNIKTPLPVKRPSAAAQLEYQYATSPKKAAQLTQHGGPFDSRANQKYKRSLESIKSESKDELVFTGSDEEEDSDKALINAVEKAFDCSQYSDRTDAHKTRGTIEKLRQKIAQRKSLSDEEKTQLEEQRARYLRKPKQAAYKLTK